MTEERDTKKERKNLLFCGITAGRHACMTVRLFEKHAALIDRNKELIIMSMTNHQRGPRGADCDSMFSFRSRPSAGRRFRDIVSLFLMAAMIGPALAEDPAWLEQARAGWRRWSVRPLPRAWVEDVREIRGGKVIRHTQRVTFSRHGRHVGFVTTDDATRLMPTKAKDLATFAFGVNERYHFVVHRASRDAPAWGLKTVFRSSEDDEHPEWNLNESARRFRFQLVSIGEMASLAEIFDSPHAKVASAEAVSEKDMRLYKIVFKWEAPRNYVFPKSNHRLMPAEYTIWLHPERDWCVVRENAKFDKLKISTRVEYVLDEASGWCVSKTGTAVDATGKEVNHEEATYHILDDTFEPPDDWFYLAGYGIPEPAEFQEKRSWWLPLAIAGILCVVVGIWLMRSRK